MGKGIEVKHRILYLNPISKISGAERSLELLLRTLDRGRFDPVVALPGGGPLVERLRAIPVAVVELPLAQLKARNPFPYLKTVWRLYRLIRQGGIALVHCNMDICNQYGLPAARLARVPIVCHTRNILGKRAYDRMFLRWADVLIANSQAVAESYRPWVRPTQRMEVVYNGVDLGKFSPHRAGAATRQALGLGDGDFVVANISRIHSTKGQHIFIEALAQVIQRFPKVRGLVVGDTQIDGAEGYLEGLKAQVKRLGLEGRVLFTGFIEDIASLYAACDLVVVASEAEPFGRTLIEAMATGLPVVATASGGPLEVVVEGKTGLLVAPGDAEAMAGAIARLAGDARLREAMGARGRERAEQLFSAQETACQVERIYEEVIAARKGSRPV